MWRDDLEIRSSGSTQERPARAHRRRSIQSSSDAKQLILEVHASNDAGSERLGAILSDAPLTTQGSPQWNRIGTRRTSAPSLVTAHELAPVKKMWQHSLELVKSVYRDELHGANSSTGTLPSVNGSVGQERASSEMVERRGSEMLVGEARSVGASVTGIEGELSCGAGGRVTGELGCGAESCGAESGLSPEAGCCVGGEASGVMRVQVRCSIHGEGGSGAGGGGAGGGGAGGGEASSSCSVAPSKGDSAGATVK